MNSVASRILGRLLWATGVSGVAFRRAIGNGRFVLEFHGVPSRPYKDLPMVARSTVWVARLEQILSWLSSRVSFLAPNDLLYGNRPGVLLSFDDGFANNYDVVLPLLERFSAPAVFFIATAHLDARGTWLPFVVHNVMSSWEDPETIPSEVARDLYDGMSRENVAACAAHSLISIGAHSVNHPRLTTLDNEQLRAEVRSSKETLEKLTGGSVDLFAYPYGDADQRVASEVAASGFSAAFVEKPILGVAPPYAVPRIGLHQDEGWYLAAKLSGWIQRPLNTSRLIQ